MKQELKFIKDEDGFWFIDLPEWTGSKSDLQMVIGADTLLDILAENKNDVALQVDTESFEGSDKLSWYAEGIDGDASHGGAMYRYVKVTDKPIYLELWLCDVTKFVFDGEMPDYIYFKNLK